MSGVFCIFMAWKRGPYIRTLSVVHIHMYFSLIISSSYSTDVGCKPGNGVGGLLYIYKQEAWMKGNFLDTDIEFNHPSEIRWCISTFPRP